MAVAFVAVGAITDNNATIPFPAGTTGDLLLLVWESDTGTDSAAASGWTGAFAGTTGSHRIGYLWKYAASGSSGTQAFTGLSGSFFTGQIYRYSGTHASTPINVGGVEVNSITTASITTTVANCMEFAAISYDAGASVATPPAGWTERQDGGVTENWYTADRILSSAGASGTATFQSAGASGVGIVHLAIAPPAGGVTGPTYVKEVGAFTDAASGAATMTVAAGGVPVGDVIVIYGSADNTGTSGVATTVAAADNHAATTNVYTLQSPQAIADPVGASAGVQGFMLVCPVTTALSAGDVITITFGAMPAAKAVNAQQFHGVRIKSSVLAGSYVVQNDQTSTTNSVAGTATVAGQVVCALVAVEGGTADSYTQDADTTAGAWVALTRRGSGTTTSGSTLNSVYKITTATGAQTYDPTLGTARDHCAALLILDVPVAGTIAVTTGATTSAAAGKSTHVGTIARSTSASTSAAAGASTHVGTVARSTDAAGMVASGTAGGTTHNGTIARTTDAATSAAAGKPTHVGTIARSTTSAGMVASGTAGSGTFVEPFTQADGNLGNGWANDAGIGGSDPIVRVVSNKGSTLSGTGLFAALKTHGLDVSGDWQIDFDAFAPLTVGHGGVTVVLFNTATGSGYGVFVGNAVHIQRYNVGGTHDNLTNFGRPNEGTAGNQTNHVTLTHTAAGDFAAYLDGAVWGTTTDTTVAAGATVLISLQCTDSPTPETTIDNLTVQDAIVPPSVSGTIAVTTGAATSAASGRSTHVGTLARSTASAGMVAVGRSTHVGTVARTLDQAVAVAAGTVGQTHNGTIAVTTGAATSAASGRSTHVGTLARSTASAGVVASGTVGQTHNGTIARSTDAATMAAAGSSGTSKTGTIARTTDAAGMVAVGRSTHVGTIARSTTSAGMVAVGASTHVGTVARTTASAGMAAAGTVGQAHNGTIARTTGDATASASGRSTHVGTIARSTTSATMAALGSHGSEKSGLIAVTTASAGMVAAGKSTHVGTITASTASAGMAAAGRSTHVGTIARSTTSAGMVAAGRSTHRGTIAVTLAPATAAAHGGSTHVGILLAHLDDAVMAAYEADMGPFPSTSTGRRSAVTSSGRREAVTTTGHHLAATSVGGHQP